MKAENPEMQIGLDEIGSQRVATSVDRIRSWLRRPSARWSALGMLALMVLFGSMAHRGPADSEATPLRRVSPFYSESARRAGLEGEVELSAVIGPDGRVRDIQTVRSLGLGLDENAADALRRWKFKAAVKDGRKTSARFNVVFAFALRRSDQQGAGLGPRP